MSKVFRSSRHSPVMFLGALLISSVAGAANGRNEKTAVKQGFNFGLLPVVNYNYDLGFQGGLLGQVYHYGSGDIYPNYYHKIQTVASIYSKGAVQLDFFYDSKYLIPGKRVTASLKYFDSPLDVFYGFNGAVSPYYNELDLRKDEAGEDGIAFYALHKKIISANFELQGRLARELNWIAGAVYMDYRYSDTSASIYDGTETLYHQYVANGLISPDEASGGKRLELKAGMLYDTRNFESFPESGTMASLQLTAALDAGGSGYNSLMVSAQVRKYLPLVKDRLILAGQLACTARLAGRLPFYALSSPQFRGVSWNRFAGDGVASSNLELRWRIARFALLGQNISLGVNGFLDAGRVIQYHKLEQQLALSDVCISKTLDNKTFGPVPSIWDPACGGRERMHFSAGGGFFYTMNENFIISFESGFPLNRRDGLFALRIDLGFMF